MTSLSFGATHEPVLLAGIGNPHVFDESMTLANHRAVHGSPLPAGRRTKRSVDEVIVALQRDEVRGRGGANFPFAIKLQSIVDQRKKPLIVVNAAEGEPASAKDLGLLSRNPHLILDGAISVARLVGASEVIIWLHHGSPALGVLRRAIDERVQEAADISIKVAQAPDRFVSGQVTSVVQGLSGGIALPYVLKEQPSVKGVNGRPTLVSNAETYALVATTLQHGAASAGHLLTTVMDAAGNRTIIETIRGTSVSEVLSVAGVSVTNEPILVGGYAGSWLTSNRLPSAVVDTIVATEPDIRLGVALFAVADPSWCPVALTSRIVTWLASQSAGQCGPCAFGLPATADALNRLTQGVGSSTDLDHLVRWLPMLTGRGACAHPDGVVGLVRATGESFANHLWDHVNQVPCTSVRATYPWPALEMPAAVSA